MLALASIGNGIFGGVMANISIRNLDDKLYQQLQLRATKHGVSMEEEVRQIIARAISVPANVSLIFEKYFGEKNGINLEGIEDRPPHEPMSFDE